MNDTLFIEIDKFDAWAKSHYNVPRDDIGGEWECDYTDWDKIYTAFKNFLAKATPNNWTDKEKEQLLYIIARDNESEYLSDQLNETALITLTKQAIASGHRDDKWQLAIQLYKLSDQALAITFLEAFVNDEDEYVNRRALMELGKLNSDKVEMYAALFWTRNKYGDMDRYQKMAVLDALKAINSKQLEKYIKLAKEDGRKYLVDSAIKIETE